MSKLKFSFEPFKIFKGIKWKSIPTEFKWWIAFIVGIFSIIYFFVE